MGEQIKTIGFAVAVCLVCSLLLAGVSSALQGRIEQNRENDRKKKVLTAFGEYDANADQVMNDEQIKTMFDEKVTGMVLDSDGKHMKDLKVGDLTNEQINKRDKDTNLKEYYPLYIFTDDDGKKLYAIHISGMGLWDVVKGYIALEDDLATIKGIAIYEHKETPGLGAKIEKQFFTDRFKGSKLFSNGKVLEFRIVKTGQATDEVSCIDGIAGATMTCNGLQALINSDFEVYNKYFENEKLRN